MDLILKPQGLTTFNQTDPKIAQIIRSSTTLLYPIKILEYIAFKGPDTDPSQH